MQPTPRARGNSGRLATAAAVLVVLLVTVAVSSHAGFGHAHTTAPSRPFIDWGLSAFLVLFVLAIPVAGYAYLLQAREVELGTRRRFEIRVGVSVLFVLALFALLLVRLYLWHGTGGFFHVYSPGGHGSGRSVHSTPGRQAYTPHFEWPVLIAFGVVLAGLGVFALRRRGATADEPADAATAPDDELAVSIGEAIDDLEREPDARRAVIAAYARMEGVLARRGLGRRASETPLEYLRRTLLALTRSLDAVTRLTALFEVAKFSDRPVDTTMKDDAIAALREIREGLIA